MSRHVSLSSFNVGGIEVVALADGYFDVALAAFSGAPEQLLASLDIGGGQLRTTVTAWALRTGSRLMLIDVGAGHAMGGTLGDLPSAMRAAQIEPAQVTDIVITHMHLDHFGGLVRNGAPAFPNADVHLARAEWDFWIHPDRLRVGEDSSRRSAATIQLIARRIAPQIVRYDGDADLGDGVQIVLTPGHTPGHLAVELASEGGRHCLLGDLLLSSDIQFAYPDATFVLDDDLAQSVRMRRRIFEWLADEGVSFSATHLPYPGSGHVARAGAAFRFDALAPASAAA